MYNNDHQYCQTSHKIKPENSWFIPIKHRFFTQSYNSSYT